MGLDWPELIFEEPEQPKKPTTHQKTLDELEAEAKATVAAAHPRIAKLIDLMWGTWEADVYLANIIVDDRGNRKGFDRPVLGALMTLAQVHKQKFKTEGRLSAAKLKADPFADHRSADTWYGDL